MSDFKVGDRVTYGTSTEVVRIERLWFEDFRGHCEPQEVASLIGSTTFSMRTAHLHHFVRVPHKEAAA